MIYVSLYWKLRILQLTIYRGKCRCQAGPIVVHCIVINHQRMIRAVCLHLKAAAQASPMDYYCIVVIRISAREIPGRVGLLSLRCLLLALLNACANCNVMDLKYFQLMLDFTSCTNGWDLLIQNWPVATSQGSPVDHHPKDTGQPPPNQVRQTMLHQDTLFRAQVHSASLHDGMNKEASVVLWLCVYHIADNNCVHGFLLTFVTSGKLIHLHCKMVVIWSIIGYQFIN